MVGIDVSIEPSSEGTEGRSLSSSVDEWIEGSVDKLDEGENSPVTMPCCVAPFEVDLLRLWEPYLLIAVPRWDACEPERERCRTSSIGVEWIPILLSDQPGRTIRAYEAKASHVLCSYSCYDPYSCSCSCSSPASPASPSSPYPVPASLLSP